MILAVGDVSLKSTRDFPLRGVALGTIAVLVGYHALARAPSRRGAGGGIVAPGQTDAVEAE